MNRIGLMLKGKLLHSVLFSYSTATSNERYKTKDWLFQVQTVAPQLSYLKVINQRC